jgi:ketosteroid isomerase-like protein
MEDPMNSNIDKEILALEERLTAATRNVDVPALDALYADDIIFTGVTGVVCDKPGIMDEARRGQTERQAATSAPGAAAVVGYEKADLRAVRHGTTAVSSFQFAVTIRANDQEVTRRYRTTNVWMKRADAWQVVAAHTAMLG